MIYTRVYADGYAYMLSAQPLNLSLTGTGYLLCCGESRKRGRDGKLGIDHTADRCVIILNRTSVLRVKCPACAHTPARRAARVSSSPEGS